MGFLAGATCGFGLFALVAWVIARGAKEPFVKHAALAILCAKIRTGEVRTLTQDELRQVFRDAKDFCERGIQVSAEEA